MENKIKKICRDYQNSGMGCRILDNPDNRVIPVVQDDALVGYRPCDCTYARNLNLACGWYS